MARESNVFKDYYEDNFVTTHKETQEIPFHRSSDIRYQKAYQTESELFHDQVHKTGNNHMKMSPFERHDKHIGGKDASAVARSYLNFSTKKILSAVESRNSVCKAEGTSTAIVAGKKNSLDTSSHFGNKSDSKKPSQKVHFPKTVLKIPSVGYFSGRKKE